jgi:glycosyltransferase involved in cell wall biosynthesis
MGGLPYSDTVPDPLLSVIIPTRDRPEFLVGAVESVLSQTMRDIEVVVADDGSGPEGAASAIQLAERDERVRVVRLERSIGAAAARNRALDRACGDLVGFLDDDDEWAPDAARVAVAHLMERSELGGVSAWHDVVPDAGRTVLYRGPVDYDAGDLLWDNFPAVPFAVLRRRELGDELRFDEQLVTCEDWDLFLRCARRRPLTTLPKPLYRYRQRRAPRVTASNARRIEGRRRFLVKHDDDLSPACRSYHAARVEIMATQGLRPRMALASQLARGLPPRVTAILARQSLSARVGALTADPGRSARTLLALTRRVPPG